MASYFKIVYIKCEENLNEAVYSIKVYLRAYFLQKYHGEKFWTRTRSKYTNLGEFEIIWL